MPSQSEKQRQFIFIKRGEFKTKDKTPEKWKWIWDKDWEVIKRNGITKKQIKTRSN